jgi:hypothetical protein
MLTFGFGLLVPEVPMTKLGIEVLKLYVPLVMLVQFVTYPIEKEY